MFKLRRKFKDNKVDDSLVRDLCQELDRERVRRAELESRLNELEAKMKLITTEITTNEQANNFDNTRMIQYANEDFHKNAVGKAEEKIKTLIGQIEELKRKDFQKRVDECQNKKISPDVGLTKHRIKSLETERDGLIEIINSLTSCNEAIKVAEKAGQYHSRYGNANDCLPLEMIRLLEFTPWNYEAQKYCNVTEEVFEWQALTADGWSSKMIHFPVSFIIPSFVQNTKKTWNDGNKSCKYCDACDENTSCFNQMLSPYAILTNKEGTKLIDIKKDILLPSHGTWVWIGGFKVDLENQRTDSNGWSYANDKASMIDNKCHDTPISNVTTGNIIAQVKHKFRRRRWIKQCVLVSYPCIGDAAKNFLRINAENAGLRLSLGKLTGQLLDMQGKINEYEDKLALFEEGNLTGDVILQQSRLSNHQSLNNEGSVIASNANTCGGTSFHENQVYEQDNQPLTFCFDNLSDEARINNSNESSLLVSLQQSDANDDNTESSLSNDSFTLIHVNNIIDKFFWKHHNKESIIHLD